MQARAAICQSEVVGFVVFEINKTKGGKKCCSSAHKSQSQTDWLARFFRPSRWCVP